MDDNIIKAISEIRPLTFQYKGKIRQVEPHTFGQLENGHDAICAWQTSGGSGQDFRLYLVREISSISVQDEKFSGPRAGYHRRDQRFSRIFAEL